MKTNRQILLLVLLLCGFFQTGFLSAQRVSEIRSALLNPHYEKVLVVSHRGNWRSDAPENSLAAIDSAIHMGVDIVELDVWKTKDGHLVLMHDHTVDRTTNGKGEIAQMTLAEIKQLRLKDRDGKLTEYTVPTLEEGLLRAKGKIMVNLDKASGFFEEVFTILKKTGTVDMIIMKGGQPAETVERDFGKYLDEIIYMPIVVLDEANAERAVENYVKLLKPAAFEMCYSDSGNRLPLKLKEKLKGKSLLWYNTLWDSLAGGHTDDKALEDADANYGYLIETLGARIIQTDRPALLLGYLRKNGWHD